MNNLEQMSIATREYRETLLKDPFRPGYHFCVPDGAGLPGDPNGYFYADGCHHLMYLYHRGEVYHWGHVSSHNLTHWRHHPDALAESARDGGCFSGGAFLDDDGVAYLTYWIYSRDGRDDHVGIGIASARPPYDIWERRERPIISSEKWGFIDAPDGEALGCADPSNIWKWDGVYYLQAGNLMALNKYGRAQDSPEHMRGDWTDLYSSRNLIDWEHRGRFYARRDGWTDASEDDMCPSFLPLPSEARGGRASGAYLQLFISHNRGCQYYIGAREGERFIPSAHGRMSWADSVFFAPEAAIDGAGRQIMFAWLQGDIHNQLDEYGWSGTYSLPRALWLRPDGELGIAPPPELDALRLRSVTVQPFAARAEGTDIACPSPLSCEIHLSFICAGDIAGVKIMNRENGDCAKVCYDPNARTLAIDIDQSGTIGPCANERAPLTLGENEALDLRIYVDRSVIEVFANDKQAVCRRVFSCQPCLNKIEVFGAGECLGGEIWEMMPSMPY